MRNVGARLKYSVAPVPCSRRATPCRKNLKNFKKNSPACHAGSRCFFSGEKRISISYSSPPARSPSSRAAWLSDCAVASSILYLYFSTPTKEEKREVAEDSEQRGGQASRNPLLALRRRRRCCLRSKHPCRYHARVGESSFAS